MDTISSENWSNPFADVANNNLNSITNLFTPGQLNILQLLNQRNILEQYQKIYTTNPANIPTGNIHEIVKGKITRCLIYI
jgi:hypothetical protein